VRGLGGSACDPAKHEHELSGRRLKRYEGARQKGKDWWAALDEAGICDACKVFGTTGWRRRFRLEVRPLEGEIDFTEGMFPSGRVHYDRRRQYRVGGWLLRGGYFGTLELHFTGEERILLCEILPTLLFIEQWGALGPKTSIGYGVIEITKLRIGKGTYNQTQGDWRAQLKGLMAQKCQESRVGKWWWIQEIPPAHSPYQGVLPALTNMFFSKARFKVTDSNWWSKFREIQWLQSGSIDENEAYWTGKPDQKPRGPYEIPNPLRVSRIEHWVRCHNTFLLSPIVRTYLRYGYPPQKVKPLVGDKPDFFGFVERKNRQQSRIHVSWAYKINGQWEMRFWGWEPNNSNIIMQMRKALGVPQKQRPDQEGRWHTARTNNDTLWSQNRLNLRDVQVCWFSKVNDENTDAYLQALLQGCSCENFS